MGGNSCVPAVLINGGELSSLPESEGGASCEKHRLGFGFGFFEEAEEGVIFNTDLPEDFTAVPAGH